MARFGRLGSVAAASVACLVIFITLNGLQHLRTSAPDQLPLDALHKTSEQFTDPPKPLITHTYLTSLITPASPTTSPTTTLLSKIDDSGTLKVQPASGAVVAETPLLVETPLPQSILHTSSTATEDAVSTGISENISAEPTPISKIVVVGRLQTEDTDWVGQELSDWQNAIYYVDLPENTTSPSGLRTKMNKAREAMPYLTYIIDNYPVFPDVIAFVHPHQTGFPAAWHNDARGHNAVNMLRDLVLETVIERGYVNLRCNNEIGCPAEIQPFRDPPDALKHAEHAYPHIYSHFFNTTMEEMREQIPVVATQCCAQFAVSSAQIGKRPKEEYEKYRQYLEETSYDDDTAGRVMEYMWHIIFGRDAVHCENVFECWCAIYGRCHHGAKGWKLRRWLGQETR